MFDCVVEYLFLGECECGDFVGVEDCFFVEGYDYVWRMVVDFLCYCLDDCDIDCVCFD